MKPPPTFKFLSILIFLLLISGLLTYRIPAADENPCLMCHVELKEPVENIHAAMTSGCQTCHKLVEGRNHPEQKNSVTLTKDIPGLCYSCHDRSKFKGKSIHPPAVSDLCTACHNPHQSKFRKLLLKDIPGLCYECHKESKFKGKIVHAPVREGLCLNCHKAHASNFKNILVSEPSDLCFRCHDKAPFSKKYVHVVAAVPNGCMLCHNPHVNDNQYLLLKPVFDLCTNCHSREANGKHILGSLSLGIGERIHPVKGIPDPSNPSKELLCISCHNPHSSDFRRLFVQKNLCKRCHKEEY